MFLIQDIRQTHRAILNMYRAFLFKEKKVHMVIVNTDVENNIPIIFLKLKSL